MPFALLGTLFVGLISSYTFGLSLYVTMFVRPTQTALSTQVPLTVSTAMSSICQITGTSYSSISLLFLLV